MYRPLSSLVPTADELLKLEVKALGNILLTHLKSYEGVAGNTVYPVYQNGLLSQSNFLRVQDSAGTGAFPRPKCDGVGAA
jgi:hypothetical protein